MLYYDKYKPATVDDYVWTNDKTKKLIIDWIANPLDYPSLVLAGSTGTGKTSISQIIRTALVDRADVKFIPASMRSGVENIRTEIVNFCEAGGFLDLKLVIFDEADRLSMDAQQMLRNVIDRYSEDVRFIMTCNYPDKLIAPLKEGRMWMVPIEALDEEQFLDRLLHVLDGEAIDYASDASVERLEGIVAQYYPNLRGAISEVQRSSSTGVLSDPPDETINVDWEDDLIDLFSQFSVAHCREFVTGLRLDDFEKAYHVLCKYSELLFGDCEKEAIIIIADHLYRGSQAGLPDITLLSCLISLNEME
jgi:DNA polymerase III delta prime subunit